MFKKINQPIIYLGAIALWLFNFSIIPVAQALPADTLDNLRTVAKDSYSASTNENTLLDNASSIIKTVLSLLGFIFVVLIIYAGILWMTAGGKEEQVKKAGNIITRAVIGLVIVVLAYAITYFVFANLPSGGGGAGPA